MSENKKESSSKGKGGIFGRLKGIKNIELVCVVLLSAVVMVVFFSTFSSGNAESNTSYSDFSGYVQAQEEKLAQILSNIKGAGKVEVMISYSSGVEYEYAYETKTQKVGDTTTTTTDLIFSQGKPIIVNEKAPKIKGIVIVAQGASDPSVKLEMLKAVQTLLGVAPGTIEIFALQK